MSSLTLLLITLLCNDAVSGLQYVYTRAQHHSPSYDGDWIFAADPDIYTNVANGQESYTYVNCEEKSEQLNCLIHTGNVIDVNQRPFNRECLDTLQNESEDSELKIVEVKRLSYDKVILQYFDYQRDQKKLKIDIIDMKSCKVAGNSFVTYGNENYTFISQMSVNTDDTFDLVLSNTPTCATAQRCKVRIDSANTVESIVPFEIMFTEMRIDYVEDSIFVRGFDSEVGREKILHLDATGNAKILIEIKPPLQIVTSRSANKKYYSVCFIDGDNDKKINCRRYNSRGQLVLNNALKPKEKVRLVRLSDLTDKSALLAYERYDCSGEKCDRLFFVQLNVRRPMEGFAHDLKCNRDKKAIVYKATMNKGYFIVNHGCVRDDDADSSKKYLNFEVFHH